ncbi:hypothetical protein HPB48_026011 [Haemaphysalis longicornis]|uniref:Uncharacterized protein n=1 Tax=Haemaphysalis longicornis TaxID=44386 RepID=A0A9J6H9P0_HAELO|nr:hypothetical protein HPB48_026011 [Haemaphysalis longicornis]
MPEPELDAAARPMRHQISVLDQPRLVRAGRDKGRDAQIGIPLSTFGVCETASTSRAESGSKGGIQVWGGYQDLDNFARNLRLREYFNGRPTESKRSLPDFSDKMWTPNEQQDKRLDLHISAKQNDIMRQFGKQLPIRCNLSKDKHEAEKKQTNYHRACGIKAQPHATFWLRLETVRGDARATKYTAARSERRCLRIPDFRSVFGVCAGCCYPQFPVPLRTQHGGSQMRDGHGDDPPNRQ